MWIIKYASVESANSSIPPANEKQEPAALTNKKQDNFDQIIAHYLVKWSKVHIYNKKYIIIYFFKHLEI